MCDPFQNKSAFLCGVMKTYRQREKQGSKVQESTKGPDESKIKVIYRLHWAPGPRVMALFMLTFVAPRHPAACAHFQGLVLLGPRIIPPFVLNVLSQLALSADFHVL